MTRQNTNQEIAELAMARDRGEAIERAVFNTQPEEWKLLDDTETFNFVWCRYRIAKPAPKKVKVECWKHMNSGTIELVEANSKRSKLLGAKHSGWTRLPQLDMEYEE